MPCIFKTFDGGASLRAKLRHGATGTHPPYLLFLGKAEIICVNVVTPPLLVALGHRQVFGVHYRPAPAVPFLHHTTCFQVYHGRCFRYSGLHSPYRLTDPEPFRLTNVGVFETGFAVVFYGETRGTVGK